MESVQKNRYALLLVDDEATILSALKRVFRASPFDLHTAQDGTTALQVLQERPIDLALVDLMMPDMSGLALLAQVRETWPAVKVVIMTGYGGVREAVQAMQMGAVDFIQKPFESESLLARIEQLHHIWRLELENRELKAQVQFRFGFDRLVGNARPMLKLKQIILQVAHSDASILIQGETGTGKELVARAIHCHSLRKNHPYVAVDCAGINESVMGSELFGHIKGAFTGAHESTPGLIRTAHGGTLFLDEVGELSLSMQVKLLRTIQEKEVRSVGGSQNTSVDVRFLAATNRDLEREVAEGRFRQDLYYRLNVIVISVPPLRERRDDIPLLANYFCEQFRTPAGEVKRIDDDAMSRLMAYDWPGNVRELENAIRRAVAMGQGEAITLRDLPENIHCEADRPHRGGPVAMQPNIWVAGDSLAAYEEAALRNALQKCGGNRKRAAGMLGIGEATLYRKFKKYRL